MEVSMTVANILKRKSIKIYAHNYKTENNVNFPELDNSEIDVETIDWRTMDFERNLHDEIFGWFSEKPILNIKTTLTVDKVKKFMNVHEGNTALINLGRAEYYLSNFIARNLRLKDVIIQQTLQYQTLGRNMRGSNLFYCNASDKKIYTELSNYNKLFAKRSTSNPRYLCIH